MKSSPPRSVFENAEKSRIYYCLLDYCDEVTDYPLEELSARCYLRNTKAAAVRRLLCSMYHADSLWKRIGNKRGTEESLERRFRAEQKGEGPPIEHMIRAFLAREVSVCVSFARVYGITAIGAMAMICDSEHEATYEEIKKLFFS